MIENPSPVVLVAALLGGVAALAWIAVILRREWRRVKKRPG